MKRAIHTRGSMPLSNASHRVGNTDADPNEVAAARITRDLEQRARPFCHKTSPKAGPWPRE